MLVLMQGLTVPQDSLELQGSNDPPSSASTVHASFSASPQLHTLSGGRGDLGVVDHNCYPNTQEVEAGELTQLPGQPGLHSKFQASFYGNTRKEECQGKQG